MTRDEQIEGLKQYRVLTAPGTQYKMDTIYFKDAGLQTAGWPFSAAEQWAIAHGYEMDAARGDTFLPIFYLMKDGRECALQVKILRADKKESESDYYDKRFSYLLRLEESAKNWVRLVLPNDTKQAIRALVDIRDRICNQTEPDGKNPIGHLVFIPNQDARRRLVKMFRAHAETMDYCGHSGMRDLSDNALLYWIFDSAQEDWSLLSPDKGAHGLIPEFGYDWSINFGGGDFYLSF